MNAIPGHVPALAALARHRLDALQRLPELRKLYYFAEGVTATLHPHADPLHRREAAEMLLHGLPFRIVPATES